MKTKLIEEYGPTIARALLYSFLGIIIMDLIDIKRELRHLQIQEVMNSSVTGKKIDKLSKEIVEKNDK